MTQGAASLSENLRQMIAVLETERQALAGLEADGLIEASQTKDALCAALAQFQDVPLDSETRELAQTAKALNETNRRVRNLLAANVAVRLEALGSPQHAYKPLNLASG